MGSRNDISRKLDASIKDRNISNRHSPVKVEVKFKEDISKPPSNIRIVLISFKLSLEKDFNIKKTKLKNNFKPFNHS